MFIIVYVYLCTLCFSMYILLRGKVTIYILYASKAEGDDDKSGQPVITARGGDALRKELGTFVCPLGQ